MSGNEQGVYFRSLLLTVLMRVFLDDVAMEGFAYTNIMVSSDPRSLSSEYISPLSNKETASVLAKSLKLKGGLRRCC